MEQRKTKQRAAIRLAFEDLGRPLSPAEVLQHAQNAVEGLGIATVYRNISQLVEEGWLVPVEMPGGQTLYERAGKNHHHHFHCERCDRVFELEGCVPTVRNLASPGFQVSRHEIVLYGLCAECQ
jgi:Fur family ferric uptake transcriptional regulator